MFETLTKGFKSARHKLAGVTELTAENIEPALRDVRLSLLEADVGLSVAKAFVARVQEQAVGQVVQTVAKGKAGRVRVGAAERFVQICQRELEQMMAFEGEAIDFAAAPKPTGIMMVGLQGSGKTTSAAKLARLLTREHERKPLLVAADVARPGAVEQLQVLGAQIDVPVFSVPGGQPVDICAQAVAHAKKLKRDTIIYDTAGRLAIDEPLMQELDDIKARTEPQNVFLVVDAMIGQDSVKTAKAFHERLGLSGVVLTKLDGDARGGAALSIKEVTGAPVKLVGMGEGLDKLEPLRADGLASRILGMGDVIGLMKDFEGVIDEEKAERDAQRMLAGQFTLDDFLQQIEMLQGMGPLGDILEKLPGFGDTMPEGAQIDDRELVRTKAIVSSMTRQERRDPDLFRKEPSRLKRVARGAGREANDVAELLQRFAFMRQMMGGIGQQAGMLSKLPGMRQLAGANQMRKLIRTGGAGLDDNPMLANLADTLLEAAVAEGGPGGGPGAAKATARKPVDRKKRWMRRS